jgi:hypothetical protein
MPWGVGTEPIYRRRIDAELVQNCQRCQITIWPAGGHGSEIGDGIIQLENRASLDQKPDRIDPVAIAGRSVLGQRNRQHARVRLGLQFLIQHPRRGDGPGIRVRRAGIRLRQRRAHRQAR